MHILPNKHDTSNERERFVLLNVEKIFFENNWLANPTWHWLELTWNFTTFQCKKFMCSENKITTFSISKNTLFILLPLNSGQFLQIHAVCYSDVLLYFIKRKEWLLIATSDNLSIPPTLSFIRKRQLMSMLENILLDTCLSLWLLLYTTI